MNNTDKNTLEENVAFIEKARAQGHDDATIFITMISSASIIMSKRQRQQMFSDCEKSLFKKLAKR